MRQYAKAIILFCSILCFIFTGFIGKIIFRNPERRRWFHLRNCSRYSRLGLKILGVRITLENPERLYQAKENFMMVANHLSYLDGLLMASIAPVCFVTSVEMQKTFFLGTMTEMGGCLYVERRSRENLTNEIGAITHALQHGFNIVLFPEATSTNGSAVLPFKRSLLKAAVDTETNILALTINYHSIDGAAVTSQNRDLLCWYGDMGFASHFFAMMRARKIEIKITVHPQIQVTKESTRDTLIDAAYKAVTSNYKKIV